MPSKTKTAQSDKNKSLESWIWDAASTGSKVKHTSPTKLRAVKVGIPATLTEQEEIASALTATEQKIRIAKDKETQLQSFFRTLLHDLMTAKTHVQELHSPIS